MILCNRSQYRHNMRLIEELADKYENMVTFNKEDNSRTRQTIFQWYNREIIRQDEWNSSADAYYIHIFNSPPEVQVMKN